VVSCHQLRKLSVRGGGMGSKPLAAGPSELPIVDIAATARRSSQSVLQLNGLCQPRSTPRGLPFDDGSRLDA
jgi:hypothetical protein